MRLFFSKTAADFLFINDPFHLFIQHAHQSIYIKGDSVDFFLPVLDDDGNVYAEDFHISNYDFILINVHIPVNSPTLKMKDTFCFSTETAPI